MLRIEEKQFSVPSNALVKHWLVPLTCRMRSTFCLCHISINFSLLTILIKFLFQNISFIVTHLGRWFWRLLLLYNVGGNLHHNWCSRLDCQRTQSQNFCASQDSYAVWYIYHKEMALRIWYDGKMGKSIDGMGLKVSDPV